MDQMSDLIQKLSSELRSGLRPALDNFIGFFHAIDWKVKSPLKNFYLLLFHPFSCSFWVLCFIYIFWHFAGTLVDGVIGVSWIVADNNYLYQEAYQLPDVLVPFCTYDLFSYLLFLLKFNDIVQGFPILSSLIAVHIASWQSSEFWSSNQG